MTASEVTDTGVRLTYDDEQGGHEITVDQVIVLVDREEGGRQAVEEQVSRVQAVFTLSQLRGSR